MYADMVGYSRLIGLDDHGTLERLRSLRRNLIGPAIEEHGGRIVQTGGDSLLVVFDSIDGAVRCAVKVQLEIPAHDADQSPDRSIRFRIGINIGDAIADGTDLHGDAVNVVARLQAECPPGGICVTRSVRDHVHGRLALEFEELGLLNLKNITRPVEAYVVRLEPASPRPRRARSVVFAGLAGRLVRGLGGAGQRLYRDAGASRVSPTASPATTRAYTPPNIGLSKAPRLSIVVLPFENLSGNPNDNYVAEGITEDVTTDLSRVPGMFVIARGTAYTYQGKSIDVRRIGEQLGVRYVLEGSVRKIGDALRVNTQLIATETGAHLWADRFDQKLNDLSAGQEEIVYRIGRTLNVALADIETARSKRDRPTNPDAFDLILRARSLLLHPFGLQEHAECIDLLERALRLDPNSIYAMTQLAYLLTLAHRQRRDSPGGLNRVADLIAAAAAIDPDDQSVLNSKAYLLLAKSRYEEAVPAFRHLLDKYPNTEIAYHRIGVCMIQLGRAEQAIPMIEKALRLAPLGPYLQSRYQFMGLAYLLLGRDEEAIDWAQRSLAADRPNDTVWHFNNNRQLAAAYARLGRLDEAHRAIAEVNRLQPYYTVRSTRYEGSLEQMERYRAALRLAGLRDHADEDADFGVPVDGNLRDGIRGLTPTTAPSATTIRTAELRRLLDGRKPIVIDTQWHQTDQSIPGAYAIRDAGLGGSMSDSIQGHLHRKMFELTKGDLAAPIVAVGWNSESFDGYNLTLRLVALGYSNVYWYRGGREAWEVAGLPETEIVVQDS
jgi:TolB-like protein/class 3 adenylate cyclase/Flp pilus assembly protein TadD